jgi:hypothetical protein
MENDERSLTAKVPASRVPHDHVGGWNTALEEALLNASDVFELGEHEVTVEFWAEIVVTNPGTIQNYCVSLTPHG